MTALAAARNIEQYDGPDWVGPFGVKASATIYHGAMVGLNTTGNQAVPASTTIAPVGVADLVAYDSTGAKTGQASTFAETRGQYVTNSGADGAKLVLLKQGVFKMKNKGGDLVTIALMGQAVYVEDDQTVRATAASSVVAGKLVGFDDRDGLPLVQIGIGGPAYGRV